MKRVTLLPFLLLGLQGCGLFRTNIVTLWTNRAEMAAYTEYFNSLQNGIRIQIVYKPSPAQAMLERKETPDLVLGEWLCGSALMGRFEPLEELFTQKKLNRTSFYKALLVSGQQDKKQVLLPVSFTLPAVAFQPRNLKNPAPNLLLPLEFLKDQGAQFNQRARDNTKRLGFSPLWSRNFLYLGCVLLGAGFREGNSQTVSWNQEALQNGLRFFRSWVEETNGGYAAEREFMEKYLVEPLAKLLDENRILFHLMDSPYFFQIMEEQKEDTDFRWLAYDNRICVDEEILFLGLPKKARQRQGARQFIEWFFQEETQRELLKLNQRKRLRAFGIVGGFSSLRSINEIEVPQLYPLFIGRIPAEDFLCFPGPLPTDWGELKRQVVVAWLYDATVSAGEPGKLEALIKAFRAKK